MSLLTIVQKKLEQAGIVEDIVQLGISLEEAAILALPDLVRRINHAKGTVAEYIAAKEREVLALNTATAQEIADSNRFATSDGVVAEPSTDSSDGTPSKKKSKATAVPVTDVTDTPPTTENASTPEGNA